MPVSPAAPQRYINGNASAAFKLTWRGKEVADAVNRATIEGMRETLVELVTVAQALAPVDTGALRDDISYEEPHETEQRIYARWGNFTVRYSIFQNWGTYRIQPVLYLERAMDAVGQHLPANIKQALRGYR